MIWKKIRKRLALLPYFRVGRSWERLARLQAFRMKGLEMSVIGIYQHNDGCFIHFLGPFSVGQTMIWVDHPVKIEDGKIQVKYNPKPEKQLLIVYGRFGYRSEPSAYLTLVE